jgi:predicted TIM-barrel fold metal-dependent hydrolase
MSRYARDPWRFIDAHVHLWDLSKGFAYPWLDEPDDGPLGRLSEIRLTDWGAARFAEEVRHTRPTGVVHAQATNPPTDSLDETRWLAAEATSEGLPDAFIVRADLRGPGLEAALELQQITSSRVTGVRDMGAMGSLSDHSISAALAVVEKSGLSWEVACTWEEMDHVLALARAAPNLTVVLGHCGWPTERSDEYFSHWSQALVRLAAAPNIVCKISGLGMSDHQWTTDSWRPWVTACLDAFGPKRCMFGSNWPVDRIYASYESVVEGMADIVGGLTADEADPFWYATAHRVYNLERASTS